MKNSFKTYICITLFSITLWTCGSKDDTKEIILRPVKFDVVKDANSGQNKTFTGTSKTDKIINLSFRSSGIITTLDMKLGPKVKTGDLLAQLDNVQARLNYENSISALNSAESQMNTAKLNYNRIRLLYEKGSSSLSDFEAAKILSKQHSRVLNRPNALFLFKRNKYDLDTYTPQTMVLLLLYNLK